MSQPAQQDVPGTQSAMTPKPDRGDDTNRGTGQLSVEVVAVITGGDSGSGRSWSRATSPGRSTGATSPPPRCASSAASTSSSSTRRSR